nr:hypothetical protein [Tanacetum cinerariifolium]
AHTVAVAQIDVVAHADFVAVIQRRRTGHGQQHAVEQLDPATVALQQRGQTTANAEVDPRAAVRGVVIPQVIALAVGDHFQRQLIVVTQKDRPLAVLRNFRGLAQDVSNREAVFLCHRHVHARHQREVKGHVAFVAVLALAIAEVHLRVFRPLVGFGQQHAVRVVGVDLGTNLLEDLMGLRQVFVVGAIALDQVRDRVQTQAVDAHVQPIAHDLDDRLHHLRVVEVQVRLVGIETVPEVLLGDRVPRPVGLLGVEKDDPGAVILLRVIGPDVEIPRLGALLGMTRALEPGVLVRGVVDDQLSDHPQTALVCLGDEFLRIGHGAVVAVYATVLGDVIAIVAPWRRVERQQPDGVDAQRGDVVELGDQARKSGSSIKAALRGFFAMTTSFELLVCGLDAPDAERLVGRVQACPLGFAIPGPGVAGHQVFAQRGSVVRQPHFPQRQFKMAFLHVARVQVDGDEDEVAAVRRALAEVQNVVVVRGVDLQAQVGLQRRVLTTDAVELGDLGNDIAGRGKVARTDLVLLRVQKRRVDVRRVNKKVRTVAFAPWRFIELGEVLAQFGLGVAPSEIGVALGVADLAQARHHGRLGERLRQEHHFRVLAAHVGDHPLPERQRFGVGVVDAENLHALLHPAEDHVTQFGPQARDSIRRIEVDVDDVLVFLRRVFRVADGAVGAPREPARMLFEPQVVLRALNGEIECDFQAVFGCSRDQLAEVFAGTELRVNGVMPAVCAADRVRASRIIRPGGQRVVRTFAVGPANRMNWREIQHVKAHVADHRQAAVNVFKSAVAFLVVGDRAREQLIPTGELRQFALHVQRKFQAATEECVVVRLGHHGGGLAVQQQGDFSLVIRGLTQSLDQAVELTTQLHRAALGGVHKMQAPFFKFQIDAHARGVLLFQFVAVAAELIDPGFQTVDVAGEGRRSEFADPAVVAQFTHGHRLPLLVVHCAIKNAHRHFVVAVCVDFAGNRNRLTDNGLGRKLTVIDHRLGVLDNDARQLQGLGQGYRVDRVQNIVGQGIRTVWLIISHIHRASLLTPRDARWGAPIASASLSIT